MACPRIILFGISEIFTRGKGNRCVAISIKKVAFFVIFRQNSLFCYPDVLCCKKISSLRFTIDLTRLLYFNIIILEYYFSHVLTGTLGFIFPLQFRRVSLLAMVPGANSPRSKGQDSSPNLICDDEENIVKVCSHRITKTIQLTTRGSVRRVTTNSDHPWIEKLT